MAAWRKLEGRQVDEAIGEGETLEEGRQHLGPGQLLEPHAAM